jgi:membrane-associated phospholipid phosphatase
VSDRSLALGAGSRRQLVLGLGTLALVTLPALRATPARPELTAFEAVNALPDWLHIPIWPVMQCGALAAVPATAALLRLSGHGGISTRVAMSGTAAWALAKGVKRVVGRGRPDGLADALRVRGRAQTGSGFPSGHAAVATALAAGTAAAVPALRPVLVGIAATVCLSRVYVGAHLPLDVIGGAALGFTIHASIELVTRERPA